MFETLGKLARKKMLKGAIGRTVEASIIVQASLEAVRDIFGEDGAAACRVKSFRDGTVRISCERSVFAEDIRLREKELISAINGKLGRDEVTRIAATG